MDASLLVIGCSGHARVVAEAARLSGWRVLAWVDEDPSKIGKQVDGLEVVAVRNGQEIARDQSAFWVVGIGDNRVRERLHGEWHALNLQAATIIHPTAFVSPSARLGAGTVVLPLAVVHTGASVGENCIVNTAATIDHDCRIENHVHISPGAHLGGSVSVGSGSHVGIGSSVRQNIRIGSHSVIGAGSVVVRDVPSDVVVYGNPAHERERAAKEGR